MTHVKSHKMTNDLEQLKKKDIEKDSATII